MKKWKRSFISAITLISFAVILLTGCWDYRELERRAIIVGLGIEELPPERFAGKEMRMYQVIVQVVEAASASGQMGMGTQTGQQPKGYTNFIFKTPSIANGIEQITTQSDRFPILSHLQMIAVGEKVSEKGLNELFDFFSRFPQMRRHTEIVMTTGPITEYFTIPSVSEPTPSLHIAEITDSVQKTLIMPESNLGTVSKSVRSNTPFFLLTASINKRKQIVINQATVFQNFKKMGILSKNDIQNLSILHGEIERGVLNFPCYAGKKVGLQILKGKNNIRPTMKNNRPHITFQIELDTELMEYQCLGASFDKPNQLERAERIYSDILEKRLHKTIETLKKKYKADVFRLTTRLKNHPDMYKQIRKQPKTFFEQLTIDVNVDLKIRNIGDSLKTPHYKLKK
ncbi:Ger(x)C family spore germination protein [Aneurinibacillus thermoaerophilus]|uniref:Ger(x)C family spore germination protein n=1 Tax=Aneurinibacillus thermoaerophilus TaxID=143495 RepID=UPI002E1EF6C7|nr:Ger(x)C family spore germination protein [Aneurinibacillus thermoaerophilus]MED0765239.1 Ger(x)C family spore germination protein [Aneurinibacillus thermoaerophilus]